MTAADRLAAIRAREQAATPGPWVSHTARHPITAHCAETCQHPRHEADLERLDDLTREFLRGAERALTDAGDDAPTTTTED